MCQVGIVALIVVNVVNSGLVEADFGGGKVLYFLARLAKVFVLLMVAVVQLVEHLVVIQDVAGSSPVGHPFFRWSTTTIWSFFYWETILRNNVNLLCSVCTITRL